MAIWVDDLVIFGKYRKSINDLKVALKGEYEMKDLANFNTSSEFRCIATGSRS